jgi:hypothetical protein
MPYYFLAKDYDALIAKIEALITGSSVAACAGGHCMNGAPAARHGRGHHRPRSPDLPSLATAGHDRAAARMVVRRPARPSDGQAATGRSSVSAPVRLMP